MSGQINRAAQLWKNWEEKEKMLLEVFGHSQLSENLNREKYDFLTQGIARISKDTSPDEKLVLGLIKKAAVKLEKQLYPHPVMRLLRRIKKLVYDRPMQTAREKKAAAENMATLSSAMGKMGLNAEQINLQQHLRSESPKLDVALLSPFGGGHYGVKLHMEKDQAGQYWLSGFTASLKDPADMEKIRSYTFPAELGINTREALNLLQGRAVMKYDQIGGNRMASKWVQLDFKLLSPEGKPILRETSADHEFNISQEATRLALAFQKPELAGLRAVEGMEQGNQIALKQVNGETTYLEADPLKKSIAIRDARGKTTSLEQVLERRKKAQEFKPEMKLTKSRSKQKQQDQSMGIA